MAAESVYSDMNYSDEAFNQSSGEAARQQAQEITTTRTWTTTTTARTTTSTLLEYPDDGDWNPETPSDGIDYYDHGEHRNIIAILCNSTLLLPLCSCYKRLYFCSHFQIQKEESQEELMHEVANFLTKYLFKMRLG